MRVLITQENGRHDENREFRECFNLQRAFQRKGIESVVWGLGHSNFSTPYEEIIKSIDVILLIENYDVGWVPDLSKTNKLKLFWSIDSHCVLQNHISLVNKNKINLVLNSIESHQIFFKNSKTSYFPNAYPSDLIKPIENVEKNIFLGFCGSYFDTRKNIIENIIEPKLNMTVQKDTWYLGKSMVEKINRYKIHFNNCTGDINYRVFETMGCNTMLLNNNTENINSFFSDMKDVVIYNNNDELIEKLSYLIENENIIFEISKKGYENVLKNHTYDNRIDQIITLVNSNF